MSNTEKSYALTTRYQGASFEHDFIKHKKSFAFSPLGCALRSWPRIKTEGIERVKRPEIRPDGKANALTSVNTDCMVCEPVRLGQYGKGGQGQRIYSVYAKSTCLGGAGGGNRENYKIDLPDGDYIVRKLTPIECERLQTLPDNYTACISNTQRYKCIGNGWTVDVIAHIFSFMDEAGEVEYGETINIFEWFKSFRKKSIIKI